MLELKNSNFFYIKKKRLRTFWSPSVYGIVHVKMFLWL